MLHAIAAFLRREGETLERAPAHEMLRVGLCLAFTGGFLDAYTYLLRGGVFANAQTGNMVLMALYAARRDGRAFYYLLPIAAFLAGVIVTEWLKARLTNAQHIAWQHVVLLAEAILVFAVGFVPRSAPDAVVNVTVSFICSLQVNSFRRTRGLPYATTMCTGNLRSAGEHVFAWAHGDKTAGRAALRYCAVILVFCAGAWAGAVLAGAWGVHAVWACSAALLGLSQYSAPWMVTAISSSSGSSAPLGNQTRADSLHSALAFAGSFRVRALPFTET